MAGSEPTPSPSPTIPLAYTVKIQAQSGAATPWWIRGNLVYTCSIVIPPVHGTVTCGPYEQATNTYAPGYYKSEPGYVGSDSFTYQVLSGSGAISNNATVNVTVTAPCQGAACYRLTTVKSLLPGSSPDSTIRLLAINDYGYSIVLRIGAGTGTVPTETFLLSPRREIIGRIEDWLSPSLGAGNMTDVKLNNKGQILLTWWTNSSPQPYLLDSVTRKFTKTGTLTAAGQLNNLGQVFGAIINTTGMKYALWDANTGETVLMSTLPGATDPIFSGLGPMFMNDKSQFVAGDQNYFGGASTFVFWDTVTGQVAMAPTRADAVFPTGLNNEGVVVGKFNLGRTGNPTSYYGYGGAFRWSAAQGFETLSYRVSGSTLLGVCLRGSFTASAVNDSNAILGTGQSQYNQAPGCGGEAATWNSGVAPLWPLLDASGGGWWFNSASKITNQGQVVGSGINPSAQLDDFVLTPLGLPPAADDISIIGNTGGPLNWNPSVSDPSNDQLSCRLGTLPANGTATIVSDCSSGSYRSNPGFIGTDSFTYISNDGISDSHPGTVTVVVTEGSVDQVCVQNNPVSQFSQTGKGGTLTISFTGNITSHTNKVVKACPGTTLGYQTTSTRGPVVCKVKNNTTRGSGSLKINDHLKCTDKPVGKDKVHFKVKSGVNQ